MYCPKKTLEMNLYPNAAMSALPPKTDLLGSYVNGHLLTQSGYFHEVKGDLTRKLTPAINNQCRHSLLIRAKGNVVAMGFISIEPN